MRERSRNWLVHLVVPVLGAGCLLVVLASTEPITRGVGLCWLAVGVLAHLAPRLRRQARWTRSA